MYFIIHLCNKCILLKALEILYFIEFYRFYISLYLYQSHLINHTNVPIALGILAASGQLPGNQLHHYEFAGELSLSGQLRPIRGALAMTFAMQRSQSGTPRAFILPQANADEAALVSDACIYPAHSLLEVCAHLPRPPARRPCNAINPCWQRTLLRIPTLPMCRGSSRRDAHWRWPPRVATTC